MEFSMGKVMGKATQNIRDKTKSYPGLPIGGKWEGRQSHKILVGRKVRRLWGRDVHALEVET